MTNPCCLVSFLSVLFFSLYSHANLDVYHATFTSTMRIYSVVLMSKMFQSFKYDEQKSRLTPNKKNN